MSDSDTIEASRRALLRYYNSQTITHVGSFIAVAGVILALFCIKNKSTGNDVLLNLFFFSILDFLVALGFYLFGRILYFRHLASEVLHAMPDVEGIFSEKTIILQLHENTAKQVRNWFAKHFDWFRYDLMFWVFMILLVLELLLGLIIPYNVIVLPS